LIVAKGQVTIVDYKNTADRLPEHREQIKEYMEIVKGIYPKAKLKGFILYLNDFCLEEVIWKK